MKQAITNDGLEFPEEQFSKISDDAKDFIKTCLAKNYNDRPQVSELLQHRWIKSLDEDVNVDEAVKINIG